MLRVLVHDALSAALFALPLTAFAQEEAAADEVATEEVAAEEEAQRRLAVEAPMGSFEPPSANQAPSEG